MGHRSTPQFTTLHALRIKGFATVDVLAEMTSLAPADVEGHLDDFQSGGQAQFREGRALWRLTPDGRETHRRGLDDDLRDAPTDALAERYATFLGENVSFKELCGRWQLRDGRHNDHADPRYDAEVLAELGDLHDRAAPVVADFGELFERMRPYQARLSTVLDRLRSGETGLFTGVMCGSYHDVWMELHEDLILTQRVDRAADGGD